MKFKALLLFAACGTMLSVAAQSHHGYFMKPTMEGINAYNEDNTKADITLNCWYTPTLVMPMIEADGSIAKSTIYKDNKADMIVRPTTINGTKKYYLELTGTSVTPDVKEANFKNGYLEITVPSKMDYPRTDPATPAWVNINSNNGVMIFHSVLGSSGVRINDAGNSLSATGDECKLGDMTGLYIGIKAPAGCKINAYITGSGAVSQARFDADQSGIKWNPNLVGIFNTMAFDFNTPMDGTYQEITSTNNGYNATVVRDLKSAEWPNGFSGKYLDIVISGVKPGDVVGFGGMQTLHDGWTPKSFISGAGVNDIFVDNANAPVEIYNINGVRVNNDNLTPGVYVKRQGSETSKFIVK